MYCGSALERRDILRQQLFRAALAVVAVVVVGGCGTTDGQAQGTASKGPMADANTKTETAMNNQNLPISGRFNDLEAYLDYLQRTQAPVDGPWYREVRPGVYELQTGNLRLDTGEQQRIYTKAELEEKFGFSG